MKTINYSEYYDRVYGGWIGKCIGGSVGADMENNKFLMELEAEELFCSEIPPNDDLDIQILWLQVFEKTGIYLNENDLADAWKKHCWYPFNEYGYFMHNYKRKIHPPVSGSYNNQFFRNSMGCPIRSEIWGMVAIGNPQLAMEYAYKDGVLDHTTESVWAEQMLAAMEAMAFFENDFSKLLEFGLSQLPEDSILKKCVQYICQQYEKKIPWREARQNLLKLYGSPDASDAVVNVGFTVLSMLYGEYDFGKTMLIAINCGYDTDCTAATAGALLGIMAGAASIPGLWLKQANDTFVIGIDVQRPSDKISDLATDTCRVGIALSRTLNRDIMIENIPDDLNAEIIPATPGAEKVIISADYLGEPEIDPLKPKDFILNVNNKTDKGLSGKLMLEATADYTISPLAVKVDLAPDATLKIPLQLSVNPSVRRFASGVTVKAEWYENNVITAGEEIGFSQAQPYYVIGPFWDLYDTSLPGAKPYYDPVSARIARPATAESFNNYVNLDKCYIGESTFGSLPAGTIHYAAQHKLPVDQWIGMSGPACLYIARDIEAAKDMETDLVIGNSDGFRLWVNNEFKYESRDPWYWMPYNHRIRVGLKKGINRIVIKLIRRGKDCDFSLAFADASSRFIVWLDDIISVCSF